MARVCTWWHAYTFDNCFRRLVHKPEKMFAPYVKAGMTVMDIGCGMGFNSIGLAKMVGVKGCVIAVDMQQKMLKILTKRAKRAGVDKRIRTHLCKATSLDIEDQADFINAFWMVHETPDVGRFFRQVRSCLKTGGKLFVAEPRFHVSSRDFYGTLSTAKEAGLILIEKPHVIFCRSAIFLKRS